VLIGSTIVFGEKRFGLAGLRDLAMDATRNIVNIVAILAGVGFIVGSLSYTGVGGAFLARAAAVRRRQTSICCSSWGALTSFILGMGMTASACYIFLAITLGPALVGGGTEPDRRPPVHPLLGPHQLHHAAGGARFHRCRQHRAGRPLAHRHLVDAARADQLRAAVTCSCSIRRSC
jgi:hypothetical protein